MALHDKLPIPPIVSLRRAGDIIGLLPLLRFLWQKQNSAIANSRIKLVVHQEFTPVLEGVSYVEPVTWAGDMDDPLSAVREFKAINAQVHGRGMTPVSLKQVNFAKHAWNMLGYEWNRHVPLVFDKRDATREKKLSKQTFKTELPKLLVKLHSFSSPMPDADRVRETINAEFGSLAEIVNLDAVNGERIYDLLGLMDRAACLISSDTVTLWLAKASKCPVVAFVNPKPFLGSPPTGNVLCRLHYSDVLKQWDRVASAIHSTLFEPDGNGIVLAFNDYLSTDEAAKKRELAACSTWNNLGARLYSFPAQRTSTVIGDSRGTPFIRDMIDGAISSGPEGIIAICNNDAKFDPKLRDAVIESCREFGCYWAYRIEAPGKETDHGGDFFAFTRAWWFQHRHLYPDMLMGYLWWDDLMVRMMRWTGCAERQRLYYHEPHPGVATRPRTKGSDHNEILAHEWLKEHHELNRKP